MRFVDKTERLIIRKLRDLALNNATKESPNTVSFPNVIDDLLEQICIHVDRSTREVQIVRDIDAGGDFIGDLQRVNRLVAISTNLLEQLERDGMVVMYLHATPSATVDDFGQCVQNVRHIFHDFNDNGIAKLFIDYCDKEILVKPEFFKYVRRFRDVDTRRQLHRMIATWTAIACSVLLPVVWHWLDSSTKTVQLDTNQFSRLEAVGTQISQIAKPTSPAGTAAVTASKNSVHQRNSTNRRSKKEIHLRDK